MTTISGTASPAKVKRSPKLKTNKPLHPAIASVRSTDHKTLAIDPKPTAKVSAIEAKPSAPKAEKPTVAQYSFETGHTGPSDGINQNVSRVAIDFSRFGTLKSAPLTDRDRKNLDAFRSEFGNKQFERGNLDTGIIRRLGERGMLVHVKGSPVDPKATFKLCKAA